MFNTGRRNYPGHYSYGQKNVKKSTSGCSKLSRIGSLKHLKDLLARCKITNSCHGAYFSAMNCDQWGYASKVANPAQPRDVLSIFMPERKCNMPSGKIPESHE
jgi:hypothetical protein